MSNGMHALTIEHALHEGSRAQVAALHHVQNYQQVGGQAEEDCGNECASDRKQRDGAEIPEELSLLECEAGRKHNGRQQPVEEGSGRKFERRRQACELP